MLSLRAAVVAAASVLALLRASVGVFIDTGLLADDYFQDGDLNLGASFALYDITPNRLCGTKVDNKFVQMAQTVVYMVDKINRNPTILPNITLGFVIVNDCKRQTVAVTKVSKFVPVHDCVRQACEGTTYSGSVSMSGVGSKLFYDVVAYVGGFNSALTVTFSGLLSQHRIPQLGLSTSDELGDKVRYEYYSRIIPADMDQAKTMVGILQYYNWTYISTVNSEGTYGATGIRNVHKFARAAGICVAFSLQVPPDFTDLDYDQLIGNLRKHRKARVVIVFLLAYNIKDFFRAIGRMDASREFVFIISEGFGVEEMRLAGDSALNAIAIGEPDGHELGFERYYLSLNPWHNATGNPWVGQYQPEDVGCEFGPGAKNPCENYKNFTDFPDFVISRWHSNMVDQVQAMVLALHSLISKECPEAFVKRDRAFTRRCVRGDLFLQYLRNTTFEGVTGPVAFDSKGDPLVNFKILHLTKNAGKHHLTTIGRWDPKNQRAIFDETLVRFYEKNVTYRENDATSTIPESVCAKPCKAGEFYIQGELACCWQCRRCRDNEFVLPNRKSCEICPENTWPDQVNFTNCRPIPPTYLNWFDSFGIGLVALSSVCVLAMLVASFIFIKHRDRKVIKGSNRELMIIITMGALLAYVTVFLYIKTPVTWSCYCTYVGFHLSCTLIFCPLFVKTYRLYRIFSAAEKCQQTASLLTVRAQLMVTLFMVIGQAAALTVVAVWSPPTVEVRMPIKTERYSELLCPLPLLNLVLPLTYNMLLLLLCAVFGFLTRKLPENFNESWYIFISVTTTLFVWTAFLPTYFMAFYANYTAALLALALILNGAVTFFCLYAPKIYALYYVTDSAIKITNFETETETMSTVSHLAK